MDNVHIKLPTSTRQAKIDPIGNRIEWLSTPHVFAVAAILLIVKFDWSLRWLISGAPVLTYSLLVGAANGNRFLPFIPLWSFLTTLNLVYSVVATSWLLYWVFVIGCYPMIIFSGLFQFDLVSRLVRKQLRAILKDSHFIRDKIALFNLPALEIDTEVQGLMVIRGITLSLSSLTVIAHGVEVAIKLLDDMEMAITTDKVTVSLFRKIEIDDVYANLKGEMEMTFGDLVDDPHSLAKDEVPPMISENPSALLRAATMSAQSLVTPMIEKTEQMSFSVPHQKTVPKPTPVKEGLNSVEALSPDDDDDATSKYETAIEQIAKSSVVYRAREKVLHNGQNSEGKSNIDIEDTKQVCAAICARLHGKAAIPHPTQKSIKVTAIRNMSSPTTKRILHRLPMLLRLLLNPLSYFHPIQIKSITVGGSGKWIQHLLQTHVFKHYSETSNDIRRLEARVNSYLSSANFLLQLNGMASVAHVPFITTFEIEARLSIADIIVYRTLPQETSLAQSVRLHGADASVAIPTFLLPHHEHLLPPRPTKADEEIKEGELAESDRLEAVHKADELKKLREDEANIKISARARLPAVFDQHLLDFIAALIKATKFIEIEKSLEEVDDDVDGDSDDSDISTLSRRRTALKDSVKAFGKSVNTGMEKTWRRGIVGGMANDRWIAKLVGKVTKLLETVRGDVGYSGEIPVPLGPYRPLKDIDMKILR